MYKLVPYKMKLDDAIRVSNRSIYGASNNINYQTEYEII